jgi:hypothetical protein
MAVSPVALVVGTNVRDHLRSQYFGQPPAIGVLIAHVKEMRVRVETCLFDAGHGGKIVSTMAAYDEHKAIAVANEILAKLAHHERKGGWLERDRSLEARLIAGHSIRQRWRYHGAQSLRYEAAD